MVFIRENSKLLFVLLLPVYFFIVHQALQNTHSHFYANGIVITHSHPVDCANNQPINDHDHTETEICFYHLVTFDYFTSPDAVHVFLQPPSFQPNFYSLNEQAHSLTSVHLPVTRGPPVNRLKYIYQVA